MLLFSTVCEAQSHVPHSLPHQGMLRSFYPRMRSFFRQLDDKITKYQCIKISQPLERICDFEKLAYSLSWQELNEKIDSTVVSVCRA